uniref:prophage tail fiber N-terminal domain-containing protein n=1 Tax=Salmonella enterica TaxID=28901 RepID=UPI0009B012D6|nr:prophage tail fiber N-terminal domain-containing protein [Salmonella enterica]
MPVLISGVLKDATGTPVQNCTIQLKACRTSTTVVVNTVASENPDEAGRYSMDVESGQYSVILLVEGFPPSHAGTITVYEDSLPGTLNDFLMAPGESDLSPEIVRQLEELAKAAKDSANAAVGSATASAASAEDAAKSAGAAGSEAGAAKVSADASAESAAASASSAAIAGEEAKAAKVSETNAKSSEATALASKDEATRQASAAADSATAASSSAEAALKSAGIAGDEAKAAAASATEAEAAAEEAKKSATGLTTVSTDGVSVAGDGVKEPLHLPFWQPDNRAVFKLDFSGALGPQGDPAKKSSAWFDGTLLDALGMSYPADGGWGTVPAFFILFDQRSQIIWMFVLVSTDQESIWPVTGGFNGASSLYALCQRLQTLNPDGPGASGEKWTQALLLDYLHRGVSGNDASSGRAARPRDIRINAISSGVSGCKETQTEDARKTCVADIVSCLNAWGEYVGGFSDTATVDANGVISIKMPVCGRLDGAYRWRCNFDSQGPNNVHHWFSNLLIDGGTKIETSVLPVATVHQAGMVKLLPVWGDDYSLNYGSPDEVAISLGYWQSVPPLNYYLETSTCGLAVGGLVMAGVAKETLYRGDLFAGSDLYSVSICFDPQTKTAVYISKGDVVDSCNLTGTFRALSGCGADGAPSGYIKTGLFVRVA